MAIGDDFSVAVNGDIRYTGTTTNYPVIEFHQWLADLADDEVGSGNDLLDITSETPSARSTDNIITLINGYNIDDTASEHLFDGSIIQGAGVTEAIYDGFVNFGNAAHIEIHQDGALIVNDFWNGAGTPINADATAGISTRFMIKVKEFGADFDGRRVVGQVRELGNSYAEFGVNGTSRGNNVFALSEASDLNNTTIEATIAGWTGVTLVTSGYNGLLIDGSTTQFFYTEWNTNQPTRTINEFYERLKWIARRGSATSLFGLNGEVFRGITHEIVYDTFTTTAFDESSDLVWGTEVAYDTELASGLTVGEYYEFDGGATFGQLLALDDNGAVGFAIFGIQPGGAALVTGQAFTRADGTATDGASINVTINDDGAAYGVGRILADDGAGAAGTVWVQVLKGTAPTNNLPIWEATTAGIYDNATGDTALVNVTVTSRTISTPWVGQSTGSALIGAYGLGVQAGDLTSADTLFDLANATAIPPNNVTFTVSGLISGEDRVLVGPELTSALDRGQETLNGTLNGGTVTSVTVNEAEANNTPSSGTIRIQRDSGVYSRHPFSDRTGFVYTITSHSFVADPATTGNNVFISYIDELATGVTASFTTVFDGNDTLFVRVRDGGTAGDLIPSVTFETTSALNSGGGTATAIRTSDA